MGFTSRTSSRRGVIKMGYYEGDVLFIVALVGIVIGVLLFATIMIISGEPIGCGNVECKQICLENGFKYLDWEHDRCECVNDFDEIIEIARPK